MRVSAAALGHPSRTLSVSPTTPPAWLEGAYYVQVFYATMGPALGLSFGSLGILMLGTIALGCVLSLGRYSVAIMRAVAVPAACGLSALVIQLLVHRSAFDTDYVRGWIPWVAGILVLQHLALRRGFLHRASLVMFGLGLATLPFVRVMGSEQRTGLAATITIANPNDFGAWFGFCGVYFAILAIEARRPWLRGVAWILSIASLLILTLSVSRAPLFAAAVCIVFALKRVLKKSFVPLLFLIVGVWVAFAFGLFDQALASYAQRGLEETGRLDVWPLAIARFLDNPLFGVGAKDVITYLPDKDAWVTPHNTVIFIALSSGLVPFLLAMTYGLQLLIDTVKASPQLDADAAFHRPLLLYAFLIVMNLNTAFMLPWVMVIFASVTAAGLFVNARQAALERSTANHGRRRAYSAVAARGL